MIRLLSTLWLAACIAYFLLWQECGENPFIFCYRIVWGAFTTVRSRNLAPVPVSPRTYHACSKPYGAFSNRFTMSKG